MDDIIYNHYSIYAKLAVPGEKGQLATLGFLAFPEDKAEPTRTFTMCKFESLKQSFSTNMKP